MTRFNPTVNGRLHVGHAYLLRTLRDSADELIVRFEFQRYWNWVHKGGERMRFMREMREDVEWLGIGVERWTVGSEYLQQVRDLLRNEFGHELKEEPFAYDQAPEVIGGGTWYPFTESLTAEKVVMDFLEGVTWLIRGVDLLTEFGLYCYFVDLFGLPRVRQTFVPRLYWEGDVVSKTAGRFKIRDFRDKGMTADEFWLNLSGDCLMNGSRPWTLDNLVDKPVLGRWADELFRA